MEFCDFSTQILWNFVILSYLFSIKCSTVTDIKTLRT